MNKKRDDFIFINLSNGLFAIEKLGIDIEQCRFLRIQSTACEQKRWEQILIDLPPDFMLLSAIGKNILVYDFGARRDIPRAIWQGLEWVKYCLYMRWYNIEYKPVGDGGMANYFYCQYQKISRSTKAKLDYYGKFSTGNLNINAKTESTLHDGDIDRMKKILSQQ